MPYIFFVCRFTVLFFFFWLILCRYIHFVKSGNKIRVNCICWNSWKKQTVKWKMKRTFKLIVLNFDIIVNLTLSKNTQLYYFTLLILIVMNCLSQELYFLHSRIVNFVYVSGCIWKRNSLPASVSPSPLVYSKSRQTITLWQTINSHDDNPPNLT